MKDESTHPSPHSLPATTRIADLSSDDKPREKALRSGIKSLSNAELLAIIFGGGLPGKSVVDLSRDILASVSNSLTALAKMSIGQMSRSYKGIGPAKAIALAAAFELGMRCRDEHSREAVTVRGADDAYDYIRGNLDHLDHEEFWILILNRANRIVGARCVSKGGTAMTVVDVKMVVRAALDNMASGLILAHNHPSGNLNPSPEDDRLTAKIKAAAELFDIKVLDHIVVGHNAFTSYHNLGKL